MGSYRRHRGRCPRTPYHESVGLAQDESARGDTGGAGSLAAQGQVARDQSPFGWVRADDLLACGQEVRRLHTQSEWLVSQRCYREEKEDREEG